MELRTIDTRTLQVVQKDVPVCLSKGTKVKWFGYSDENAIYV
jgi:hypothetical protein